MATTDTTIPTVQRAVVCHGVRDYRVQSDRPLLGPPAHPLQHGALLVRVTRCGICAGDAKCFNGAPMFWGDDSRPPYVQPPVVPGHEFVGIVSALGPGAGTNHGVQIGDQVTAEQVVACGDCLYCSKGLRWLCQIHDIYGFHTCVPGGMAEYMVFPSHSIVHKIPKAVPPKEACFVEPLSCSIHGVDRGRIELDDTVVVSGCGPIGLGMVASAKLKKPGRLLAIDCNDTRLELARACGADVLINPLRDNVVDMVKSVTAGYGCDVYLEASGNPTSVEQGLGALRKAGRFVEFSVFASKTTVDWTIIGDTKELDIYGAHCSGDTGYAQAISMIQGGSLPLNDIISHELKLEDCIQGLSLVNSGTESVKVILDPTI